MLNFAFEDKLFQFLNESTPILETKFAFSNPNNFFVGNCTNNTIEVSFEKSGYDSVI